MKYSQCYSQSHTAHNNPESYCLIAERRQIQLTGCCWKWPFPSSRLLAAPLPSWPWWRTFEETPNWLRVSWGVWSEIRVTMAQRNLWCSSCGAIHDISRSLSLPPPPCLWGIVNGWVQLKTSGGLIKCKRLPGRPPTKGNSFHTLPSEEDPIFHWLCG